MRENCKGQTQLHILCQLPLIAFNLHLSLRLSTFHHQVGFLCLSQNIRKEGNTNKMCLDKQKYLWSLRQSHRG